MRTRVTALALTGALMASTVWATTIRKMNDQELVAASNVVAIGKVTASKSLWIGRSLYTQYTLRVSETLKGNPGEQLSVLVPGGYDFKRKVPIGQLAPGAVRFAQGEEAFLFLRQSEHGYAITGFSQGAFSVSDENGEQVVSHDLRGFTPVGKNGPAKAKAERGIKSKGVALGQFKQHIKDLIGGK